jgi:hypothetical protein
MRTLFGGCFFLFLGSSFSVRACHRVHVGLMVQWRPLIAVRVGQDLHGQCLKGGCWPQAVYCNADWNTFVYHPHGLGGGRPPLVFLSVATSPTW